MFNLLISLGVALAVFLLTALSGSWLYGILPGVAVGAVVWMLLARRTGRQLQQVLEGVAADLQSQRFDPALEKLTAALQLGRWQFLVAERLHGQIGAIAWMQAASAPMKGTGEAHLARAREHLAKSWSRDWQSQGLLAVLDLRDGKPADAATRMERAWHLGRKDPLCIGLTANVLDRAGRRAKALDVVGAGLKALPGNERLTKVQTALANDRVKGLDWGALFGDPWYLFFPDDHPARKAQKRQGPLGGQRPRGGYSFPPPRR